ncbi:MAG TPA: FAD-binding oxidoreductase [Chthoniobacterales bacterium]|nr:FAD-binding oxidoreductase [Chthoniobacterales bacterium]
MIDRNSLEALRSAVRGKVIEPGDADYDESRKVYNGMIHKKPRVIVRCSDVADVIQCVYFGKKTGLPVAVRGGGHNAGGLGICDDGLVIDLAPIRYARVDPAARSVTVGGGCTWGDVDHATHAFGLATPSGIISTTGVGGLTLGGGIGHLTRKYGLTIDNLLSADVVLANGKFVKANADENSDLFWALRGGGGNFGIVTAFTFKLHPIDTIYGGPMLYELSEAATIMKWYRALITTAPDDLNGFFAFLTVPPGPPFPEHLHLKKMCGIVWAYVGPQAKAEETFKPIRAFKKPALDLVGALPQPALQTMFDTLYPPGLQWYWKADFVNELSDDAIAQHVRFGESLPSMHSTMHLYPINGAAARVGKNDTAWNYRKANWAQVMVGVDPDPANNEKTIAWARSYYDALHPYSAGGAYVNFMMADEGEDRVKATYGDNYERLVAIKGKYDPENFFRVNQNIKPSKAA